VPAQTTTRNRFLDRLETGPAIVGDGGMGALLSAAVPRLRTPEEANLRAPQAVVSLHVSFINAGAELIETNTFGANRPKLAQHFLDDELAAIVGGGVRLAREARDVSGRDVFIAGSIGPLGDGEEAAIGHLYMLARTFRQMLVILEKNVRDSRAIWQALWQGFRVPPFAADDVIRQARRYKSRRELTRALRLIARADLALRSNPPSKRLVLENLILDLASEPKVLPPAWQQEELPV